MKVRPPFRSIITQLFAILFLGQCILGCGGSTTGTGDSDSIVISGRVLNLQQQPLPGTEVTDIDSGQSTQTSSDGQFTLNVPSGRPSLTLLIRNNSVDDTIEVATAGRTQLQLIIRVDEVNGIVVAADVAVEAQPSPSPTASGTPGNDSGKAPETPKPNPAARWTIHGVVQSTRGTGFDGVSVRVTPGGNSTITSQGNFTLEAPAKGTSAVLDVAYKGLNGSVRIGGLPDQASVRVSVTIELSIESSRVDPNDPDSQNQEKLVLDVLSINRS